MSRKKQTALDHAAEYEDAWIIEVADTGIPQEGWSYSSANNSGGGLSLEDALERVRTTFRGLAGLQYRLRNDFTGQIVMLPPNV